MNFPASLLSVRHSHGVPVGSPRKSAAIIPSTFELGDVDRAPSLSSSDECPEHQLQDRSLAEGVGDDLEATERPLRKLYVRKASAWMLKRLMPFSAIGPRGRCAANAYRLRRDLHKGSKPKS